MAESCVVLKPSPSRPLTMNACDVGWNSHPPCPVMRVLTATRTVPEGTVKFTVRFSL